MPNMLYSEQSSMPYCVTWSFTDIGVSSPCFNGSLWLAVVSTNCVFKYTNLGCWDSSGFTEDLAVTYNAPTTTLDTATTPSTTSPSTSLAPPPVIYTTPATSSIPGTSSSGTP